MQKILLSLFVLLSSFVSFDSIVPSAIGAELCSGIFKSISVVDSLETRKIHDQITRDLYNGEIISWERNGKVGLHVTVRVKDPVSGKTQDYQGYLKPRFWGDRNTWHPVPYARNERAGRSPMEYVAYHLNRLLGWDYVPPTVYRRGLNIYIDGEHITEGSISLIVPDLKAHTKAVVYDTYQNYRVLNRLMHNPDGNPYNSGVGRHWVSNKIADVFWDFSASFGQMAGMRGGPRSSRITSPAVRRALIGLKFEDLKPDIDAGLITAEEVQKMLSVRDKILSENPDEK